MVARKFSHTNLGAKLVNLARGGQSYRHLRFKVFNRLIKAPLEHVSPLGDHNESTFFDTTVTIENYGSKVKRQLNALALSPKDFKNIDELNRTTAENLGINYLKLASGYITANLEAINRLRLIEDRLFDKIMSRDPEILVTAFEGIDDRDTQSVFIFKLLSTLNTGTPDLISKYFMQNGHSGWVKHRLLYPLMYSSISTPGKEQFEDFMDAYFTDPNTHSIEKEVISLILMNEGESSLNLSSKCYVGMLSHPYDLLQILIDHFEYELANENQLDDETQSIIFDLFDKTKDIRLAGITRYLSSAPNKLIQTTNDIPFFESDIYSESYREYFSKLVSHDDLSPVNFEGAGSRSCYHYLSELYNNRYPKIDAFTAVNLSTKQFLFLNTGRFLDVLLTGIYMVERRSKIDERVSLLRHLSFLGGVSEYTLSSPRGHESSEDGFFKHISALKIPLSETFQQNASAFRKNRWWIKKFHWEQFQYADDLNLSEWFLRIRENIPISKNKSFLSGVDWTWIEDVRRVAHARPFKGKPNAIYTLLIKAIENKENDPMLLMTSLEPFISEGMSFQKFVETLNDNFREDSLALVAHFFQPNMILMMDLAGNYTAAVSERIEMLAMLINQYGFSDEILTKDQYESEIQNFITILTYSAVGDAQFEVPWDTFERFAIEDVRDLFSTYEAFLSTTGETPVNLGEMYNEQHSYFSNGQYQQYRFQNKVWPLVNIINHSIGIFLTHPSWGIEAILAIRIRHDNMRREIAAALEDVKDTHIPGTISKTKVQCLEVIEPMIFSSLKIWVEKYIHTPRGSRLGIFDYTPSQKSMEELIDDCSKVSQREGIICVISKWLQSKLFNHLKIARRLIDEELVEILSNAINEAKAVLMEMDELPENHIEKVCEQSKSRILQELTLLKKWFVIPKTTSTSLTHGQMKYALQRRFSREIDNKLLKINLQPSGLGSHVICPTEIRTIFDIWSELIVNALKYAPAGEISRIRIFEYETDDQKGYIFSSRHKCELDHIYTEQGSPWSTEDSMLRTGKSGLKKVAALSATLVQGEVDMPVHVRKNGFHVVVPLVSKKGGFQS